MPHSEYPRSSGMTLLKLSVYLLSVLAIPAMSVAAPASISELHRRDQDSEDDRSSETQYFQIHPYYNQRKCLDVRGSVFEDGTPVDIYDCNGTGAQNWSIQAGATQVKVADQDFCLDAGTDPVNGTKLKIWTCYDNLPAQAWYYTDDKRIALKDQGQCLDLTDGSVQNYNVMQIWECSDLNTNQIWDF